MEKININGQEMDYSERRQQYAANVFGLYKSGRDKNNLLMMLNNMEDYDVDMDIDSQYKTLSKIFDINDFDNDDALKHLINEELDKLLKPVYLKDV